MTLHSKMMQCSVKMIASIFRVSERQCRYVTEDDFVCRAELKVVVGQWDQREWCLRKQTTQGVGGSWHSGSEDK